MPAISPENSGAPEARATPRHNGNATKNTTETGGNVMAKILAGNRLTVYEP